MKFPVTAEIFPLATAKRQCESPLSRGSGRARNGGLRTDDRGVAAINFALCAWPFLLFVFLIMEIAMAFFAAATVEHATITTAREVRNTGTAMTATEFETQFKMGFCANAPVLIGCDDEGGKKPAVDVRSYANLDAIGTEDCGTAPGSGTAGDFVVVRVCYDWQPLTPIPTVILPDGAGGGITLRAATVFFNGATPDAMPDMGGGT